MADDPEMIICKLWIDGRGQAEKHNIRLYPRRSCAVCKGEIVVLPEIWRRTRRGEKFIFKCEQCSLLE